MRRFVTFGLALLVITVSNSAEAKKPKKGETAPATTETAAPAEAAPAADAPLEVGMTGMADVDSVFQRAVDPLNNLREARLSLNKINTDLAVALALPSGTPFADAIADLKTKAEGKITAAIDAQGMPKLAVSDAVPANVQNAIDAVNNGITEATAAVGKLAELPDQVKGVVEAATAISPQTLIASGVKPLEAPKIMKTVTGNMKVLGAAPDQAKQITDAMMETKNTITGAFGGA